MPSVVEMLSAYVTQLHYEDLPQEVIEQTKRLIVDTIGCALGGYDSEPSRIARAMASEVTSRRSASVMVSGENTSADLAVFANGVMIRFLDFNDGYTSTGESGHPSDSIAVVLTLSELMKRSGKDAILATVLAYEVFCRICDAVDLKPLGWDHVTVGGVASTAAAARLLGLSPRETQQAFNLGIAPNIALYQTRIGHVSMWKGCAYANASRNAVFAALLAQRGMTGPAPVFEGVGGYFKAVTHRPFELAPFGGNGQPYKIMECSIKHFPLGQYSQTVVEAALQVRDKVAVADIEEVQIETVSTAIKLMAGDPDKWEPATRETADHSMPYTVAVALIHGTVEAHHFDDTHLDDREIRALTRRVKARASEEADGRMPVAMLCKLTVVTRAGARHTAVVEYHKGHYKNPMSRSEVEEKFRKLAAKTLSRERADRLLESLWGLEQLEDAGEIVRLTVTASDQRPYRGSFGAQ